MDRDLAAARLHLSVLDDLDLDQEDLAALIERQAHLPRLGPVLSGAGGSVGARYANGAHGEAHDAPTALHVLDLLLGRAEEILLGLLLDALGELLGLLFDLGPVLVGGGPLEAALQVVRLLLALEQAPRLDDGRCSKLWQLDVRDRVDDALPRLVFRRDDETPALAPDHLDRVDARCFLHSVAP